MSKSDRPSPEATLTTPAKVLVLDDDPRWRRTISEGLEKRGLAVDSAGTIDEATRFLKDREYDLALIDIQIGPNFGSANTGLKIAQLVRDRNPDSLVIVISGNAGRSQLQNAFTLGVDDFLDKADFSLDSVYEALDKVALRREKKRESIRRSQSDRLMYETLSMMSHELRSPLITIQRNTEALLLPVFGPLNDEQIAAIKEIQAAAQRELLLINAHLDVSRVERGIENLAYQEHDLVALIKKEVRAHIPTAKLKRVNLKENLPEARVLVQIDVNRFRVALNPLMDNAIKFSREGGDVFISLTIDRTNVEVEIADQGPGMKADEIERILNPQSNDSQQFSRRFRSSGLGLLFAKRMINLHGGRLFIESDGESGTKIRFILKIVS
jgi:signal transduction histidine kinase